jgi:hypothetical protein
MKGVTRRGAVTVCSKQRSSPFWSFCSWLFGNNASNNAYFLPTCRTSEVCNDRWYSITSTFSNETYPVLLIIEAVDESASDEAFRNADRVFLNAQLLERSPEKFNNG